MDGMVSFFTTAWVLSTATLSTAALSAATLSGATMTPAIGTDGSESACNSETLSGALLKNM
jgi:uncharacterized protein YjbI with pentapeptide repeats